VLPCGCNENLTHVSGLKCWFSTIDRIQVGRWLKAKLTSILFFRKVFAMEAFCGLICMVNVAKDNFLLEIS